MRKNILSVLLAISCFFTYGCYESEFPLSAASSAIIDTQLVDYWVSIPKKDDNNKVRLVIFKFNDHEYLINWKEGNNETLITRGFITEIDDVKIINVQNIKDIDEKERTFVFFKYSIADNGILRTQIISGTSDLLKGRKFDSSEEFAGFIKKNINNKDLFGSEVEFIALEKFKVEIN